MSAENKAPRAEPFAFSAVRDLLGLVRAIYRSERMADAPGLRLAQIERSGRLLDEALALAASSPPKSAGERGAWIKAEEGAREVAELVDLLTRAEPIIQASMGAVTSRGTPRRSGSGRR